MVNVRNFYSNEKQMFLVRPEARPLKVCMKAVTLSTLSSIQYILLIREKHFSQELCSCIWCCWTRTWHSSTSRCWRLGPGVQVTKSLYYCLDQSKFAIKHFNNKFTARTNFLWWPTLLNSTTSLLNRTQILVSHLRSKRLSKSPSSPNL